MEIVKREDREKILVTKELCHSLTVFKVTEEESVVISRTDDARVVLLSIQDAEEGEMNIALTSEELRAIANHMFKLAFEIEGLDLEAVNSF